LSVRSLLDQTHESFSIMSSSTRKARYDQEGGCVAEYIRLGKESQYYDEGEVARRRDAARGQAAKVRAYTIGGNQIGLAGLGPPGDPHFPAQYNVEAALNSTHWVRHATQQELETDHRWFRKLDWQPHTIVHDNGTFLPHEDIGKYGSFVTVLQQSTDEGSSSGSTNQRLACATCGL
jgi:hypothetical protein